MDDTPALEQELASWYQSLIGMLRWMIEIGKVDIITEVSMMASPMVMHMEGHLEVVWYVFSFLHHKHNYSMALDPTYNVINMSDSEECQWKDFYRKFVLIFPFIVSNLILVYRWIVVSCRYAKKLATMAQSSVFKRRTVLALKYYYDYHNTNKIFYIIISTCSTILVHHRIV